MLGEEEKRTNDFMGITMGLVNYECDIACNWWFFNC
jgi:hypothetical protein